MTLTWKKVSVLAAAVLVVQLVIGVGLASAASPSGGTWHRVAAGETVFSIARLYGANPWCIARTNGLANPNYIQAGWLLCVPDECRYQVAPPCPPRPPACQPTGVACQTFTQTTCWPQYAYGYSYWPGNCWNGYTGGYSGQVGNQCYLGCNIY